MSSGVGVLLDSYVLKPFFACPPIRGFFQPKKDGTNRRATWNHGSRFSKPFRVAPNRYVLQEVLDTPFAQNRKNFRFAPASTPATASLPCSHKKPTPPQKHVELRDVTLRPSVPRGMVKKCKTGNKDGLRAYQL